MSPFHSATLKLTAWYLAILMAVSISFSIVIYNISANELDRPLAPGGFGRTFIDDTIIRAAREARAVEGKQHLVINLMVLNIATLALGAGASYLFARRSLRPIEEAMEVQSRFVGDASHELRTPLAVMRTENEIMLRAKKPAMSELKATLASNLEEVARLQLLTDRLLALSSEEDIDKVPFRIDEAVERAIEHTIIAAKHKSIRINNKIPSVAALGDSETISDLVSILLDNAIKYSPEKTTVTIDATQQNKKVTIRVADQGDGIREEDLPKIFDRFYRADQSRSKQNVEGHGLGLALAQRLAALNNARLSAMNGHEHGAVFCLEMDQA